MAISPPCRTIKVFAFRGNRSRRFASAFLRPLVDPRNGLRGGPTRIEALLFTGHTGVSIDDGTTIYAFNPNGGNMPLWELMDKLKQSQAFPGVVLDDTGVFSLAQKSNLTVLTFDVVLPEPSYQ